MQQALGIWDECRGAEPGRSVVWLVLSSQRCRRSGGCPGFFSMPPTERRMPAGPEPGVQPTERQMPEGFAPAARLMERRMSAGLGHAARPAEPRMRAGLAPAARPTERRMRANLEHAAQPTEPPMRAGPAKPSLCTEVRDDSGITVLLNIATVCATAIAANPARCHANRNCGISGWIGLSLSCDIHVYTCFFTS